MDHVFMVQLFKVKQMERENLHSQMDLTFKENGKMINHTVQENIKHQLVRYTKVASSMVSNLERENYILMRDCMKVLSRIIISMVRESQSLMMEEMSKECGDKEYLKDQDKCNGPLEKATEVNFLIICVMVRELIILMMGDIGQDSGKMIFKMVLVLISSRVS